MRTYKIKHEKNCSNSPFRLQIKDSDVWKDVHLYINDDNSNIAEFDNPLECEKMMDDIGISYDIFYISDNSITLKYVG